MTTSGPPISRQISFTQVDKNCGYQLKFYRERIPATRRSIALIYGSAVGIGIQHHLTHEGCDADHAVQAGLDALHKEIRASELPDGLPLAWDDPPRLTQGGRPYKNEQHRIPTQAVAEGFLSAHVRSWVAKFGYLRATAIEEKAEVPLTRPEGWKIVGYLDARTTDDGLIDFKTASETWDDEKIHASAPQLRYYQAWHRIKFGKPPAWTQFHIMIKGTTDIQIVDVPYDARSVNRWLEHRVRTNIAAIEASAFVPNTSGWWCSERFCDYWHICPLGSEAHSDQVIDSAQMPTTCPGCGSANLETRMHPHDNEAEKPRGRKCSDCGRFWWLPKPRSQSEQNGSP